MDSFASLICKQRVTLRGRTFVNYYAKVLVTQIDRHLVIFSTSCCPEQVNEAGISLWIKILLFILFPSWYCLTSLKSFLSVSEVVVVFCSEEEVGLISGS